MHESDPTDCGCAPTEREWRSFGGPVSRRGAIGLGVIGVLGFGALGASIALPALAIEGYPSWEDVEAARNNESAKADEVARIENLIQQLANDVAAKQAEAERLASEYLLAQEAFEDAAMRADQLQQQADEQAALASDTATKLGNLAAAQYREGGDNTSLSLLFSGSAATADELLSRLGTVDKVVSANQRVYDDAVTARNNAQNLRDQAVVARDERDKLKQEAEQKMVAAQEAADAAQAALDAQTEHLGTLQAQLAALKDTTAKTIQEYEAGVEAERKAREERERQARILAEQQAAAAAAAAEEQRRRDEEAANSGGGGGGGGGNSGGGSSSGGSGGSGGGSGWVRPASGYITSWWGPRGTICSGGYCTSGHRGIDFGTGCGGAIYAAASGTVVFAAYSNSWGNYIKVDHGGGIVTGYAHIRNGGYNVGYGDYVSAGQVIAYAGNTGISSGCHLHFEVYSGGVRIDPTPFLQARGVTV